MPTKSAIIYHMPLKGPLLPGRIPSDHNKEPDTGAYHHRMQYLSPTHAHPHPYIHSCSDNYNAACPANEATWQVRQYYALSAITSMFIIQTKAFGVLCIRGLVWMSVGECERTDIYFRVM